MRKPADGIQKHFEPLVRVNLTEEPKNPPPFIGCERSRRYGAVEKMQVLDCDDLSGINAPRDIALPQKLGRGNKCINFVENLGYVVFPQPKLFYLRFWKTGCASRDARTPTQSRVVGIDHLSIMVANSHIFVQGQDDLQFWEHLSNETEKIKADVRIVVGVQDGGLEGRNQFQNRRIDVLRQI